MPLPVFQVDAFTSQPFRGNPAAVCLMDGSREDGWMRDVAAEMKSEFRAFQASRRGGEILVRVEGDRVKLSGQAVTVLRGELA